MIKLTHFPIHDECLVKVDNFIEYLRSFEERIRSLTQKEKSVYIPLHFPEKSVDYVFICMEPSLGRKPPREPDEGYNFYNSFEDFILHFSIIKYLLRTHERYYITDIAKGALLTKQAKENRFERYEQWYPLLLEEFKMFTHRDTIFFCVGKSVEKFLKKKEFSRPLYTILHYSPQTVPQRYERIRGHEHDFESFLRTLSYHDFIHVIHTILDSLRIREDKKRKILKKLNHNSFTLPRKMLIYIYRTAFLSVNKNRASSLLKTK